MPEDGDSVFEGDSDSYDDFIKELDLFSVAMSTRKLWDLTASECPENSTKIHIAIYLIVHSGCSYNVGNQIFNYIRQSMGHKSISPETFTFTDKTLKKWGLSNDKISLIRNILTYTDDNFNSTVFCRLKPGINLIQLFKAFTDENEDTYAYSDYNIKKNIAVMLERAKMPSDNENRKLSRVWNGFRSIITQFLYRLKPTGMNKILEEEVLTSVDFYNKDEKIQS